MRVLFLAVRGFLERTVHFTYMLPKYLAKRGIKVTVFAPRQHSSWTTLEEGVTVRTFNSHRLFHGFEISPSQWIALFRLKEKPDVVHATTYGALETFFAYLYSKIRQVPLVITTDLTREHFLDISSNPFKRLYARIFAKPPMKSAHKIVFTGREKKLLKEGGYTGIDVIPIGVLFHKFSRRVSKEEARKKLGLPIDKKIVLSVSHAPWKGTDYILEAAELLPNILFLLAGSTYEDYKTQLEEKARKKCIRNVVITGPVPSIEDYFFAADAYVCASLYESFGTARIEAVAAGLPVITTNVGEKIPGIPIRKRDVTDIVDKIRSLFSDYKLYQKLSNQRDWAKEYDWDVVATKTFGTYQKTLKIRS